MIQSYPVLHFGVTQVQGCIGMSATVENPSGFLVSDMNGPSQLEVIASVDFSQNTAIFREGIDTEASGLRKKVVSLHPQHMYIGHRKRTNLTFDLVVRVLESSLGNWINVGDFGAKGVLLRVPDTRNTNGREYIHVADVFRFESHE